MKRLALSVCAFISLIATAQAQPKPSPSFTVFLKLCADPSMTPQTVRKAVESAGGTISIPETKLGLFNSTASNWNATVQGHKFQISAIETYVPTGHNATQEVVGCNFIDDGGDDRAGQSELKQWVGVAPDSSGQIIMPGMEILTYHFEWDGEKHTPVPDGAAARGDEEAGKVWRLIVGRIAKFTRVRLEHDLQATPKQ